MRFLLDTNIVSELIKPSPSPDVAAWITTQPDDNLFISSMTMMELRRGLIQLPEGRRRRELEEWFDGPLGPPALFTGRVLAFDEGAANICAALFVRRQAAGQPKPLADTIIAAVALANDCIMVTRNARDFEDVETLNPYLPIGQQDD